MQDGSTCSTSQESRATSENHPSDVTDDVTDDSMGSFDSALGSMDPATGYHIEQHTYSNTTGLSSYLHDAKDRMDKLTPLEGKNPSGEESCSP